MSLRAKIALGLVLTVLVTGAMATVVFAYTDWGNEQIRASVEDSLSRGELKVRVERIDDIKLFSPFGAVWVTAENIRLVGADDREHLVVGEVTTALDVGSLLGRTIHFREVRIDGAEIPVDRRTGYPKVGVPGGSRRHAFEPRTFDVQLDNVALGLYLVDTTATGEKAIVGRMHGELSATIPSHEPGVKMTLKKAKGVLSQPEAIQVLDASGDVDTSATTVADIRFSAIARGAAITGSIAYVPSDRENPIQPTIGNVRDAGMLSNPIEALQGMGGGMGLDIPMDALKQFMPPK